MELAGSGMESAARARSILLSDEKFLKFDDSPEKMSYELFANGIGPDDAVFRLQECPVEFSDLKGSETTLISMKKPGHGSKGIKNWARNLSSPFLAKEGEGLASSSDSQLKAFWRDSFEEWTIYQQFRPRVLVAGDVLDSMQLRLTYFLHKDVSAQVTVMWPPFENGVGQVSYAKLIWHHFRKEKNNSWMVNAHEKDWVEFCLYYSEIGYIRDLQSKGYDLGSVDETTQAFDIRKEMTQYITVLKQDRNVAAHIFCSSIRQNTTGGQSSRPTVRALLDTPVSDLSIAMQGNLLRMIQNLMVNPPEIFQDLKLCFKMQLHFLQNVFENHPGSEPLPQGIHLSQHNLPPPQFPKTQMK